MAVDSETYMNLMNAKIKADEENGALKVEIVQLIMALEDVTTSLVRTLANDTPPDVQYHIKTASRLLGDKIE